MSRIHRGRKRLQKSLYEFGLARGLLNGKEHNGKEHNGKEHNGKESVSQSAQAGSSAEGASAGDSQKVGVLAGGSA